MSSSPTPSAVAVLPIRQALASSRRFRFLGLTVDDAIKYFFGGNALVAILVLFLICFSLARQAFLFPQQNLDNIVQYRHSGAEYVDYLRSQVDGFQVMSRYLDSVRQRQYLALKNQGQTDEQIADTLKPVDDFKNKFMELLSPHQALLSDWTGIVSDLKDRDKVNQENVESRRILNRAGKGTEANALNIETIDFVAGTQPLRDQLANYRELNRSLSENLTALAQTLPTLPSADLTRRLERFNGWVAEQKKVAPTIEAKMAAWDPLKPVPYLRTWTSFLFGTQWITASDWQDWYGILPLLTGSLTISLVAMILAVPFGICAAIYVNQMSTRQEQAIIKPFIEFISAIPSVVLGFFGIAVLGAGIVALSHWRFLGWVPGFPINGGLMIFTAGALLAFMAVPTIFTLAEDALNNVPRSYVEASTALGSTRLQTIIKIMVPAALSGIISAILLGLGRVIGETMVLLLCAGNRIQIPDFTQGLSVIFQPAHTMTGIIAQELGEAVPGSLQYRSLFMIGMVLFVISLAINYLAQLVVKKYRISIG